ncbi:hypothetical protein H8957_016391, partial [Semnopithecus entellus]
VAVVEKAASRINRESLMPAQARAPFQRLRDCCGPADSSHAFKLQCFPSHCRRPPWVISHKGRAINKYSICISCVALHLEISFIWQLLQNEPNLERGLVISILTFTRVKQL